MTETVHAGPFRIGKQRVAEVANRPVLIRVLIAVMYLAALSWTWILMLLLGTTHSINEHIPTWGFTDTYMLLMAASMIGSIVRGFPDENDT